MPACSLHCTSTRLVLVLVPGAGAGAVHDIYDVLMLLVQDASRLAWHQTDNIMIWHGAAPCRNPTTLAAISELHLAGNDFEGNLDMFAGSHLTTVTVHENPKLCGMVPSSVRYAKSYNPAGTNLGKPC